MYLEAYPDYIIDEAHKKLGEELARKGVSSIIFQYAGKLYNQAMRVTESHEIDIQGVKTPIKEYLKQTTEKDIESGNYTDSEVIDMLNILKQIYF